MQFRKESITKPIFIHNLFLLKLICYRWKSKGTKPKGTGQKGPAKRDQPKGTKTQKGPWPKGTMAKRDQGTKGTMAKRDQGTKGTKGQKGPRHKRDHGLFKMLIIEIQIIGIPIFNH